MEKTKGNPEEVAGIMYAANQIAAALSHLMLPFLPFTSKKLQGILNIEPKKWDDIYLSENKDLIPAGHKINASELLFEKIEDETIQAQLDKLQATKLQNEQDNKVLAPQKDPITFDDFTGMDIRIGTILEAQKVAKTKKLLKLKVAVGIDTRTIVSGIAESFAPADIIGQRVSVLVNLAPRKIRGVESQGMILMTETKDGKLSFIAPTNEDVKDGESVS